jgi:hypothetical protein
LKKGALGRHIDRQIQIFEEKKDALERKIEQKFEIQIKRFEQKLQTQKKKLGTQFRRLEVKKNGIRFDDMRFIATWIEKPLTTGAVAPSGRALARTMAGYIDPDVPGPIIELGPGTGPVTEALVAQGVDPSRLVLVEFDPTFCRLLRGRYPQATVVQGDAYSLKRLLAGLMQQPPASVVRGLRPDVAGRALCPVHLQRGAANPEATRARARRSLRAHLDEHPAGAGVGLPPRLTLNGKRDTRPLPCRSRRFW